jgi:hypothetical protein
MNFLNNILSSKVSILTFLVLPFFLVMLVAAWIYMLFFGSGANPQVDPTQNLDSITSSIADQTPINSTINSATKSSSPKASFEDLETAKSAASVSKSATALSSPIASTPELDAAEITKLLGQVESLNTSDAALDNQILEN